MTSIPTWFGPADAPLFGWLHVPADGQASGCAILCPPLGRDSVAAHRTYRSLAENLAARGIVALRFDYSGTGDSAPVRAGDSWVDSWAVGVVEAANYLRKSGGKSISLIGMRLGATILTAAAGQCGPIASVVLWDPCPSGAGFLREQRALQRMALGESGDDSGRLDMPWLALPASEGIRLKALTLESLPDDDCPALMLARDPAAPRVINRANLRVVAAIGQSALLDVPNNFARVPDMDVRTVFNFVTEHAVAAPFAFSAQTRISAVVGTKADGRPLIERIESFGHKQLFGIISGDGTEPPILFLNVATEHHVGPGSLWVTLSRQVAAVGHPAVRFDLSGLGDSPVDDLTSQPLYYADESISDVIAVAGAISPGNPRRVILVGLCSGAWTAAMTSRTLGPRAAYLINPVIWHLHPKPATFASTEVAARRASHVSSPAFRNRLRAALPEPIWRLLGRLSLVHAPSLILAGALARGTDVQVLYGADDGSAMERPIGHLRGPGTAHIDYAPAVDHALLGVKARDEVARHLSAWLAAVDAIPAQCAPGSRP